MGQGWSGDDGFDERVDGWIGRELDEGDVSFGELTQRLPGVYPGCVVDSLRRQMTRGRIPPLRAARLVGQSRSDPSPGIPSLADDGLPVPHPLDYDWRFTDQAVERICDEASLLSSGRGPVGLIGAPSVALGISRAGGPRRAIVLDINPGVIAAIKRHDGSILASRCDVLSDEPPRARLGVAVTDPPWYLEDLRGTLWFCREACRTGGFVIASIPPLGTRPGMLEERAKLVEYSSSIGLELARIDPARLPYRSPPFEQNALRRVGITGSPIDWRRGDLAIFVKCGTGDSPRPEAPIPAGCDWTEIAFSAALVRVRPRPEVGFADPRLIPIVEGDVLPTVSRRDPRREHARVWTSGNRVFGCEGSGILYVVARCLSSGVVPLTGVETHLGRRLTASEAGITHEAALQLARLVADEERELRDYAGGIRENQRRLFAS